MCSVCDCCGERISRLNQQVSVMRKEIKNLRQMLDSAVRSHRKHMLSIHSAVLNIGHCEPDKGQLPVPPPSPQDALEQGNIQTIPIGYISSCFSVKTGTPRQPTICGPSRAELHIQQNVFNNPEHALVGLEQYSHVWIIFLFHKNGHLSYKAKVKPPRLNGQRVGVYSTRSPHRPNALGLTLAKLDRIVGDTIYLSDIDMIAGTPVLDIKPYIPEYDSPTTRLSMDMDPYKLDEPEAAAVPSNKEANTLNLSQDSETAVQLNSDVEISGCDADPRSLLSQDKSQDKIPSRDDVLCSSSSSICSKFSLPKDLLNVLEEVKSFVTQGDCCQLSSEVKDQVSNSPKTKPPEAKPYYGEEAYSTIAGWIREPPVASLEVRFTPLAEKQLSEFFPTQYSGPPESERPRFKFLRSSEEAAAAIRGILSADPRSVYRRTRCSDKLFFFTLDTADITCWFGEGFAEVLQIRPVKCHVASL